VPYSFVPILTTEIFNQNELDRFALGGVEMTNRLRISIRPVGATIPDFGSLPHHSDLVPNGRYQTSDNAGIPSRSHALAAEVGTTLRTSWAVRLACVLSPVPTAWYRHGEACEFAKRDHVKAR
jgi:hypothetical protein